MSGDEKPRKKARGLIRVAFSLISLAVLAYIVITLISGRDSIFKRFVGLFSSREPVEIVDEYSFEAGRSRVFADMGGAIAAVGTLGVQVLDRGGNELLRDPFRMSAPGVDASGGRAIAFDIGGTAVRVFSAEDMEAAFETESAVVSASINENGWFCVNIRESGGYSGVVTVYNNLGKDVYRVSLASGYVLASMLSADNKKLVILTLMEGGSKITQYDLGSESPDNEFILTDRLIIDIRFLPGGDILAITTDSLIAVDKNGKGAELYWFAGKRLGGYALGDGFVALHLLDYGIGYAGRLVTLDNEGTFLGTIAIDYEIISISSCERHLAVLRSDGIEMFDMELGWIPCSTPPEASAGVGGVLALSDGAALATSDHLAVVIRFEN